MPCNIERTCVGCYKVWAGNCPDLNCWLNSVSIFRGKLQVRVCMYRVDPGFHLYRKYNFLGEGLFEKGDDLFKYFSDHDRLGDSVRCVDSRRARFNRVACVRGAVRNFLQSSAKLSGVAASVCLARRKETAGRLACGIFFGITYLTAP